MLSLFDHTHRAHAHKLKFFLKPTCKPLPSPAGACTAPINAGILFLFFVFLLTCFYIIKRFQLSKFQPGNQQFDTVFREEV